MSGEPISYWRQRARPILVALLETAQRDGWDLSRLKRAIFEAYPFGPREYLPYQMWLKERKLCLRAFEAKTTISRIITADQTAAWAARGTKARIERADPDPNQLEMAL